MGVKTSRSELQDFNFIQRLCVEHYEQSTYPVRPPNSAAAGGYRLLLLFLIFVTNRQESKFEDWSCLSV